MKSIRFTETKETPWRNGGGITREVARAEDDGGLLWRLSIADVGSEGPFSDFAGLTRVLTVIRGGPMMLDTPSETLVAALHAPLTFDGGLPVSARLPNGPLRDLNLMYESGRVHAEVSVLEGPFEGPLVPDAQAPLRVVFGLAEGFHLNRAPFDAGDTVLLEGEAATLTLADGGSILLISLSQGG
ncbi:HutD family protein [Sagittula sp. NFXS13]|uniref:HutD/Ves family protein n=1 Tax=Sagittula sp. NFXS13 TaxID=2819095 RepID=UPI0032DF858F